MITNPYLQPLFFRRKVRKAVVGTKEANVVSSRWAADSFHYMTLSGGGGRRLFIMSVTSCAPMAAGDGFLSWSSK